MNMKMPIRRRFLMMMLLCSLVSLIIAVGLSVYGMLGVRSTALETGVAIGNTAAKSSSEVLEKQSQESIMQVAKDKARQVELSLQVLRSEVNMLSDEMITIMQNPQNYALMPVSEPRPEFAGTYVAQLEFFSEDINRYALSEEIGLAANIQDFLVTINKTNELVASSYIASKNGFTITADKIADLKINP